MKSSGKSNGAALRVQRRVGSVRAAVVMFVAIATIPAVGAGKRCRRKYFLTSLFISYERVFCSPFT